jgi:prevent-host-death family protein
MTTITATEASRGFKKMLDAVAQGESFTIVRDGQEIAEVSPKKPAKTIADFLRFMETYEPDPEFSDLVEEIHNEMNQPMRNLWEED